ncbi:hypothetical protein B296_00051456 [Ensete ventricosum]|uniref:Uncharacterized protein n=1 Tax=Ensete ventricosum TaxID=4639 RepID=A0A426X6D3_ENSVE|nr:hypothetical protein B296_00051456 [Ensete ventricosum]
MSYNTLRKRDITVTAIASSGDCTWVYRKRLTTIASRGSRVQKRSRKRTSDSSRMPAITSQRPMQATIAHVVGAC